MKIISKNFKLLAVFLMVLTFSACSDDDDGTQNVTLLNVVDTAIADSDLTSLVAALQRADLVDVLRNGDDWTILAPTNQAFSDYLNGTALEDVPVATLRNLLLNHVISARIPSVTITNAGSGYTNTNATGPNDEFLSIYYEYDTEATEAGVYFNGASRVEQADIFATNGVIHIVDEVIELPTIATFATTNPALETLVVALQYADTESPTVPYITTVSDATAGPYTVFAPTNDAFANVLVELDLTGFGEDEGELNAATTDAVLLMHIVNGNIQSSALPNGDITTIGSGVITADNTAFTLTDGLDREIGIVTSLVDIQAVNGVVHVVDTVIRPGNAD